ncbi:MAG: WcaF family extracellular polysaccharide biosynthesis acetyltransferase [Bacteroidetes bacterium]|nr:WcaF family extracellular polysaccharide biosynthesis acetyltransferase [Bacteroidota bacterium]
MLDVQLKTDLSKFNNSWYKPGPPVKRIAWYMVNACFFNSAFPLMGYKRFLLRLFGAKVGKGVIIKPHVNIKYPWNLKIGNHVWIGERVWIDNLAMVELRDNSCVSQGAMLLCGNHHYKKTTFDLVIGTITIDEGAWVGAMSVVCPGIKVGSHAVLTVNSVATRHLDPYGIYQGNPAEKIKDRIIKE